MVLNDGGWNLPEVARAQRALVEQQLKAPHGVPPFAAFLRAMKCLPFDFMTLIDIGCGVGHYGLLCKRYFPKIDYSGVDLSQAMIDEARDMNPHARFRSGNIAEGSLLFYDIALLSQVMEMCEEPQKELAQALKIKDEGYLILHRLRLTKEPSHQITETTYCEHLGVNYLWNLSDLAATFAQYGMEAVNLDIWGEGSCATIVLKREQK